MSLINKSINIFNHIYKNNSFAFFLLMYFNILINFFEQLFNIKKSYKNTFSIICSIGTVNISIQLNLESTFDKEDQILRRKFYSRF